MCDFLSWIINYRLGLVIGFATYDAYLRLAATSGTLVYLFLACQYYNGHGVSGLHNHDTITVHLPILLVGFP